MQLEAKVLMPQCPRGRVGPQTSLEEDAGGPDVPPEILGVVRISRIGRIVRVVIRIRLEGSRGAEEFVRRRLDPQGFVLGVRLQRLGKDPSEPPPRPRAPRELGVRTMQFHVLPPLPKSPREDEVHVLRNVPVPDRRLPPPLPFQPLLLLFLLVVVAVAAAPRIPPPLPLLPLLLGQSPPPPSGAEFPESLQFRLVLDVTEKVGLAGVTAGEEILASAAAFDHRPELGLAEYSPIE
mmetsp:Transcript_29221/g.86522  ORF Transcript_29221/g.86522 Transcript_29221/m.86522 type:complete len:236 (-) Transcript_29221:219-926(-)